MKTTKRSTNKADLIAKYNEIYRSRPDKLQDTQALYRWILDILAPAPGSLLLDVGCGNGALIQEATKRGLFACGIDISWEALNLARKTNEGRILICEGETLPFPDETFDYITNIGSLEHFFDPLKGVQETRRVLKRNGRAAILLPNSYYIVDIIWHVWRTGYGPDHKQPLERFATYGEWRDLLIQGGLIVEKCLKYNFIIPSTTDDFLRHIKNYRKLLLALIAPFIPFNLSYSFLFICKKS